MKEKEILEQAKQAQEIFTPHKKLTVRIKNDATNPFESTMFDKFLEMRKQRPIYNLYIHLLDNYMTFTCPTCKELDPARIPIDNKLWVEILCIFEIVPEKKKKQAKK